MPDFENIEQYETTDPHTGKKRVIPIAPHSYPPSTYRPRKRARSVDRDENQLPPLKKADFEVVSVEQMEREFRRSASTLTREPRNPLTDFWKWILSWFKPKQAKKKGPKGKTEGAGRARNNRSRSGSNRGAKQPRADGQRGSRKDNPSPATDDDNNNNRRSRSRRRKPRSSAPAADNAPRPRNEDKPPRRAADGDSAPANTADNKPRRRKRNRRSGSTKPNDHQQDRRE
jgi:hypothetical protein